MAILFGDTSGSLNGRQHGGAQTLVGSDPANTLFGDAGLDLLSHAVGGNDTLLTSGSGSLFGDAGETFLVMPGAAMTRYLPRCRHLLSTPARHSLSTCTVMLEPISRTQPLPAMTSSISRCPWRLRQE